MEKQRSYSGIYGFACSGLGFPMMGKDAVPSVSSLLGENAMARSTGHQRVGSEPGSATFAPWGLGLLVSPICKSAARAHSEGRMCEDTPYKRRSYGHTGPYHHCP